MKKKILIFATLCSLVANAQLSNNCATTNYLTKRDASGNLVCSSIFDDTNSVNLAKRMNITGPLYLEGNSNILTPAAGSVSHNYLWFLNSKKTDESQIWKMGSTILNSSHTTRAGFSIIEGWSSNQTRFFIEDLTGKVGIGTTNLSDVSCTDCNNYKLFVKDGIKTEKVKVEIAGTSGWADYVFAKDYKLPTLAEVESYIAQKGHLINVPSADDVKKNGIELGEMAKIQQEKIEELTLYIIQQNKINEKQAKEIDELKNLVSKLIDKISSKN